MYTLIKPLLFRLEAEHSHNLTMAFLGLVSRSQLALRLFRGYGRQRMPALPCQLAGMSFPNPLGLAAGLDKDARAFPALAALGFGWIELGTVTPMPQAGNATPRMFRLQSDEALINRMGFNNAGLEVFARNVKRLRHNTDSIIGINIGKNAQTPIEQAADDYLTSLDTVYELADYIAVNISSPNTKSLRELQNAKYLQDFLGKLRIHRDELASRHGRTTPLVLKIAPDLTADEIQVIAEAVLAQRFDAVIATNTTISRPAGSNPLYEESGGLSGRPLRNLSTVAISQLHQALGESVPIIGAGGIQSAGDVIEKLRAGAQMVQIYTGLIYQGPAIVRRILRGLEQKMQSMHIKDWSTLVKTIRAG